jgi:hypothetical protein
MIALFDAGEAPQPGRFRTQAEARIVGFSLLAVQQTERSAPTVKE